MSSSVPDPLNIVITGSSNDTDIILESANSSIANVQDGSGLLLGRVVDLENSLNSNSVNDLALNELVNNIGAITSELIRIPNNNNETMDHFSHVLGGNVINLDVFNITPINKVNSKGVVEHINSHIVGKLPLNVVGNTNLVSQNKLTDFDISYKIRVLSNSKSASNFTFGQYDLVTKAYVNKYLDLTSATHVSVKANNVSPTLTNSFDLNTMYNIRIVKVQDKMSVYHNGDLVITENVDNVPVNFGLLHNPNVIVSNFVLNPVMVVMTDGDGNADITHASYYFNSLCDSNYMLTGFFNDTNSITDIIDTSETNKFSSKLRLLNAGLPKNGVNGGLLSDDSKFVLLDTGGYTTGQVIYNIENKEFIMALADAKNVYGDAFLLKKVTSNNTLNVYFFKETEKKIVNVIIDLTLKQIQSTNDLTLVLPVLSEQEGIGPDGVGSIGGLVYTIVKIKGDDEHYIIFGDYIIYIFKLGDSTPLKTLDPQIERVTDVFKSSIKTCNGEIYNNKLYIGFLTDYNSLDISSGTITNIRDRTSINQEKFYMELHSISITNLTDPSKSFTKHRVNRSNYDENPDFKIIKAHTHPGSEFMNIRKNVILAIDRSVERNIRVFTLQNIRGTDRLVYKTTIVGPGENVDLTSGFPNRASINNNFIGMSIWGWGPDKTETYEPGAAVFISINSVLETKDNEIILPSFMEDTVKYTFNREPDFKDAVFLNPFTDKGYIGFYPTTQLIQTLELTEGKVYVPTNPDLTLSNFSNNYKALEPVSGAASGTFTFNGLTFTWRAGTNFYDSQDNSITLEWYDYGKIPPPYDNQIGWGYLSGMKWINNNTNEEILYSGIFADIISENSPYKYQSGYTLIYNDPGYGGTIYQKDRTGEPYTIAEHVMLSSYFWTFQNMIDWGYISS